MVLYQTSLCHTVCYTNYSISNLILKMTNQFLKQAAKTGFGWPFCLNNIYVILLCTPYYHKYKSSETCSQVKILKYIIKASLHKEIPHTRFKPFCAAHSLCSDC